MRAILAITSGRADSSPMEPVVAALEKAGCNVAHVDADQLPKSQQETEIRRCYAHMAFLADDIEGFKPEIVLLLGDRYETLAAALAATVAQIPIAHIHGGETSWGSFDNQIRDAITKLSHIHFVAHDRARRRLHHRLAEADDRIHVVGAPGLDNLTDLPPRKPTKTFVCTYHPATAVEESIDPLLEALDSFEDYGQVWTGVNNDPGSGDIAEVLTGRCRQFFNPRDYLLACRQAAAVVGNSSSGLIEAPSLGVPSINVGDRQAGRLSGPSVLSAPMDAGAIKDAIELSLSYDGSFRNPYAAEKPASKTIAKILATVDLEGIRVKRW